MKKGIKNRKISTRSLAGRQAEPDIMDIINKMLQQLIVLEKKIDGLVSVASSGTRRPDIVPCPPERNQGNGFRERVLHKAVCADCRKECEVPFRPSGERPVYCKECFAKRRKGAIPPKEKPENRPAERVLVYERSFHKDQAASAPKRVEKKRPRLQPARRKR